MFGEGFIGVLLGNKDDNIKMTHEEWRKLKDFLFGKKVFKVEKDVYLYKKIKEFDKLNGKKEKE